MNNSTFCINVQGQVMFNVQAQNKKEAAKVAFAKYSKTDPMMGEDIFKQITKVEKVALKRGG